MASIFLIDMAANCWFFSSFLPKKDFILFWKSNLYSIRISEMWPLQQGIIHFYFSKLFTIYFYFEKVLTFSWQTKWLLTENWLLLKLLGIISKYSNVYTRTPYSGRGNTSPSYQLKPLVSASLVALWADSSPLVRLILGVWVDTRGSYFAPIPHGVPV